MSTMCSAHAPSAQYPLTSSTVSQSNAKDLSTTLETRLEYYSPPISAHPSSRFPIIEQSDENIEVLVAWRSITSNPMFKVRQCCWTQQPSDEADQDVDMNELISEFTARAKCDGTKIVLEPQSVAHILNMLKTR